MLTQAHILFPVLISPFPISVPTSSTSESQQLVLHQVSVTLLGEYRENTHAAAAASTASAITFAGSAAGARAG